MNKPMQSRHGGWWVSALTAALVTLSSTMAWGQGVRQGPMSWHHEYDDNGNLKLVVGPLGAQSNQDFDGLNRLRKVTQPEPRAGQSRPIVELGYNGQDQLTSVTDPRKLSTTYRLNGLGNVNPLTSPDTGVTTYTYYDDGSIKTATDARGKTTTYLYDGLNRLTKATYAQGVASRYFYDGAEQQTPPFSQGRLTQITDESGSTKLGYDAYGHVLSKKQVTGERTFNVGYTYGSTGASNGKLADLRYPSQAVVHYAYDDLTGRVSGITVNPVKRNGSGTNTGVTLTLLTDLKYTAWNEPSGWAWADGVLSARSWDGYARPSTYPIGNPFGTGKAAGMLRTVGYDDAGRITSYAHTDGANQPLPAWDQSFGHDGLDRITQASGNAASYGYDYDASGNRKRLDIGSQAYANVMKTDSNRLDTEQAIGPGGTKTKYTLGFDEAGHITTGAGFTATYSARGRMASITKDGQTTNYLYNALEQRVYKAGPAVPTGINYFVYDEAGHVLGEYDASGAPLYEVIWLGDQPVGVIHQTRSGTPPDITIDTRVDFVYVDHLYTPRAIARSTDHAIVWRWDSTEPFGLNQANNNPNAQGPYAFNLRLPGQIFDAESSLHYNWHRDFDPWTGRYVQSDPIGLSGGINTYGYVGQDPLSLTDPFGLWITATYNYATGYAYFYDDTTSALTSSQFQSGGKPWGDPIPNGDYDLLQHPDPDFFRLEAVDSSYGDDTQEATGRNKFRLHKPGRTVGCIAATDAEEWGDIRQTILGTSARDRVSVLSKSRNPFSPKTEMLIRYGRVTVINSPR